MKNCLEANCEETAKKSNLSILNSIYTHGLISPHKIKDGVLTNQTTQTSELHENLCVNYVNFKDASPQEKENAYTAAFDEEYLGVFGVSLERSHPFQKISNCQLEIQERIMHQVVFVLRPPQLFKVKQVLPGASVPAELSFYNPNYKDGFSQARQKSVFTNKDVASCHRVTEIKTTYHFVPKDFIAILAPEFLYQACQEIFAGIEVIPVPSQPRSLKCLPEMLGYSFNEKLKNSQELNVPDYASTLKDYCAAKNLTQFSLHAVRLNTAFDFTIRPVIDWHQHQPFLASLKAQVIPQDDHMAWAVLHKQHGISKKPLLENLKKIMPEKHMSSLMKMNQHALQNFEQLAALKGEFNLNIIYTPLHAGQIHYLVKNGINLIRSAHFYMTHCPHDKTALLKQVVENFEAIEQQAATKIQAHFRGHRCQMFFKRYQKAKQEMELNKSVLLSMSR